MTQFDLLMVLISQKTDDCILWPKGRSKHGYGRLRHKSQLWRAHRLVCFIAHGSPPSAKHTDSAHSCGIKLCVNPAHLRWATRKENMADKQLHGVSSSQPGEINCRAKLTDAAVLEARARFNAGGATKKALADEFGVSDTAMCFAINGKTWRHL